MADYLKSLQGLFGGVKSAVSSVTTEVDDFADFATAASPAAPSHSASSAYTEASSTAAATAPGIFGPPLGLQGRPYTKWYRIWERVTIQDFYQELVIIPFLLLTVLVNLWGSHANRTRAKQWASAHLPSLDAEFAQVGFSSRRKGGSSQSGDVSDEVLKSEKKNEYIMYATGRQNVAFVNIKLSLFKRYNPFSWLGEQVVAFFFDSFAAPMERVEATAWVFDGKEKAMVSNPDSLKDSAIDGFVWAVVHKDKMKQLRDDRYDVSLTTTRDHAKLPDWATVMSESAEVTEAMLTPDLIKAINETGEDLEALIVSDQPIDAPKKLNDTVPKKRISLSMKLNPRPTSTALFAYFLRLPDHLVGTAHFRPEALRKIKATREEEMRKIRKVDEDEKAEERRTQGDKLKKEERERKLKTMSATEQKKFLEREKEKEQKRSQKKRTVKA